MLYFLVINNNMKRNYAVLLRIYPNQEQSILIDKTIGCCRFLYNQMLGERKQVFEEHKENKEEIYGWKYKTEKQYKEEFDFLKEADSIALQQSRRHLENAYNNFFKSLSGRRKGGMVGFPKFKKKKSGGSYTSMNNKTIEVKDKKHIKLPKLGIVKIGLNEKIINNNDKICSITVKRTPIGKYFCSVLFEKEVEETKKVELSEKSKVIGLDMSLTNFFVDNNGNSPAYEKIYKKHEKRLKRLQHLESRKKKNSRKQKKLRKSINFINEKTSNKRKDFSHKLSTELVNQYDVIVVESLNLKAISQGLKLGKSVMDLGYSQFINQLKYKCDWYGKHLIEADKWFASSKICHKCGYKYNELALSDRKWVCPNCGTTIERDENAAKNLKNLGVAHIHKCLQSQNSSSAMK